MTAAPTVAIVQIAMHWTTAENVDAIERAMVLAHGCGVQLCAFSELAITGFHREILREARPETVGPAVDRIAALAARLSMAVSVGAPTFGPGGERFITQLLIDDGGHTTAQVSKRGLTIPEATVFARGTSRPVGRLQGLRCSAVICREVEDLDEVAQALGNGEVDLILVPGGLRQDPAKPRTDPPAYVQDIGRLARHLRAHVVHTNWPNALNRPEESVDAGGSVVAGPDGVIHFRLPMQASGLGVFTLGQRTFDWLPA